MKDIEQGKTSVLAVREYQWRVSWALFEEKPLAEAPFPDRTEITPNGWVEVRTPTGYFLMDIDAFNKLPKKKQKLITKYGG